MPTANLDRLKRLSRILSGFSLALIAVLAGAGIYRTFTWLTDAGEIATAFPGAAEDPLAVGYGIRIAVAVLGWVALGLVIYAIAALQRMFALFAGGRVLDAGAALWMRRAGLALFAVAVYGVVAHTAMVLLISLGNAPGGRQLSIQFADDQLFSVFLAGVFVVVAHALVLGAETEQENRSFV